MTTSALAHLSSVLDTPHASSSTLLEAMKTVIASNEPFDWHPWMARIVAHPAVNDRVVSALMDAPGMGPWMVAQPRVVTMIGQASQPVITSAVQAIHASLVRALASEGPRTVLKAFLGEVNRRRNDHLLGYNTEDLGVERAPEDISYGYKGDNYRLVPYKIFLNELVSHALEEDTSRRTMVLLNAHRLRERLASYGLRPWRDEATTLLDRLWEEKPCDDGRLVRLRSIFLAPFRPERVRAAIEHSLSNDSLTERLSFFAHLDSFFLSMPENDRASPRWRWVRNAIDRYYLLTDHDSFLLDDLAKVHRWQTEAVSERDMDMVMAREENGDKVTLAMTALCLNPHLSAAQMLAMSEVGSSYYAHLVLENPALPITLLTDGLDQELLHNVLSSVKGDFLLYLEHVIGKTDPTSFFDEFHDAMMGPFEDGRASIDKEAFSQEVEKVQDAYMKNPTFRKNDFRQFFEFVDYLDEAAMMVSVGRAFREAGFPSWDSIDHAVLVNFYENVAGKERMPS